MSKYVLYNDIEYEEKLLIGQTNLFKRGVKWLFDRVDNVSTIELIFCKDCCFSEVLQVASDCPETRWCKAFTNRRIVADDDFCSYGEREDE